MEKKGLQELCEALPPSSSPLVHVEVYQNPCRLGLSMPFFSQVLSFLQYNVIINIEDSC